MIVGDVLAAFIDSMRELAPLLGAGVVFLFGMKAVSLVVSMIRGAYR